MKVIKRNGTPGERAEIDNAVATAQRSEDLVEYVAMMTDVDIPSEDEQGGAGNE